MRRLALVEVWVVLGALEGMQWEGRCSRWEGRRGCWAVLEVTEGSGLEWEAIGADSGAVRE